MVLNFIGQSRFIISIKKRECKVIPPCSSRFLVHAHPVYVRINIALFEPLDLPRRHNGQLWNIDMLRLL